MPISKGAKPTLNYLPVSLMAERVDFVFDAAGAPTDGGGHMLRSLALANALARFGRCTFALEPDELDWAPKIIARQHEWTPLQSLPRASIAIVDRYHGVAERVANWRRRCDSVAIIDDFGDASVAADLIIAPSLAPGAQPHALSGPEYALLRNEYREPATAPPDGPTPVVVVTFGLRDSRNGTSLTLRALACLVADGRALDIRIACGRLAPHLTEVRRLVESIDQQASLQIEIDDMAGLYDTADLVIGGGGVSLMERCARGRASLTLTLAKNQEAAATYAASKGATHYLGDVGDINPEALGKQIAVLLDEAETRRSMARAARRLVDGRGSERVARRLADLAGTGVRMGSAAIRPVELRNPS